MIFLVYLLILAWYVTKKCCIPLDYGRDGMQIGLGFRTVIFGVLVPPIVACVGFLVLIFIADPIIESSLSWSSLLLLDVTMQPVPLLALYFAVLTGGPLGAVSAIFAALTAVAMIRGGMPLWRVRILTCVIAMALGVASENVAVLFVPFLGPPDTLCSFYRPVGAITGALCGWLVVNTLSVRAQAHGERHRSCVAQAQL